MTPGKLYGGIEAGGTKFNCVVASGPENAITQARIETTTANETLSRVVRFFQPFTATGKISVIGLACFGPIDLNHHSPTYGFITSTPKPGWRNTDILGIVQRELDVRIAFDTDVNAAGLGEFTWGASRGFDSSLYLTIGTGVGGGFIQDGKPLHGLHHPEMGHIRIPHDRLTDPFAGVCPFHGDCFEGLACGPAVEKRFHVRPETIPDSSPYWEIEARYIASALMNYICVLSPKRIILGGGIMQRHFLFPLIRQRLQAELNAYIQIATLLENIEDYIVKPGLGNQSGVWGAIALARELDLKLQSDN